MNGLIQENLANKKAGMYNNNKTIVPNPVEDLVKGSSRINDILNGNWPKKNTAILVSHGIGNQKPIETLDSFVQGILRALKSYNKMSNNMFSVEHLLEPKTNENATYYWFDNFIRIKKSGTEMYLDIYEYYWAPCTEDKTSVSKIRSWLNDVTKGAKKHYKGNEFLVTHYEKDGVFRQADGSFNIKRYFFILRFLGNIFLLLSASYSGIIYLIKALPFIGVTLASFLERKKHNTAIDLTNVLGDITIYNDPNPRSTNQRVRKEILQGCVKAITHLVTVKKESFYSYEKVIIAGHSLGSQISFDAINRLTHQINLGELPGYASDGKRTSDNKHISKILDTYITFGSPLDKIAFFLREQSLEKEYIRAQILENFHCFKQNAWIIKKPDEQNIVTPIKRIFDDIIWRNYYDDKDYVSGALDFYRNLTNVNCKFESGKFSFTHSNYWACNEFFADILITIFNDKD